MKLTKRILVVLAAVALIVSSFAFVSSAEFTEDNIEDILEFYSNPRYFSEDFEGLETGSIYTHNVTGAGFASSKLMTDSAKVVVDPDNEDNKVLSFANVVDGVNYLGYSLVFDNSETDNEMPEELVFTVRVRSEKGGANSASVFSVNLYACDASGAPVGDGGLISPLKLDFETGIVSFAKVNAGDSSKFDQAPILGVSVSTDVWYTVTMIFNTNTGTYTVSLAEDGNAAYETGAISFGDTDKISEINASYSSLPKNASSINYIDELDVYSGTFLRGGIDRDEATAQALYDISEFMKNNEISLKTALKIAKVYEVIEASDYEPSYTQDFTEATVKKLYADAVAFIPEAYTRAFCEQTDAINTGRSYSRRQKQLELIASYVPFMNDDAYYLSIVNADFADVKADITSEINKLIAALPQDSADITAYQALLAKCVAAIDSYKTGTAETVLEALKTDLADKTAALDAVLEAEESILANEAAAVKVLNAKEKIEAEILALDTVRRESELFIVYMQEYDPEVRDYEVIKELCARIETECANRNNSYNYSSTPNVYQYSDMFDALVAKRDAIVHNVTTFQSAVAAMCKDGASFSDIYRSYNIAKSVYNDGAIHEAVDISTVSRLELDIERYLAKESELSVVTMACDRYILLVTVADESTFYNTIKSSVAVAKEFYAANTDKVIDEYPGVVEAKAKIGEIEAEIKALEDAAGAYIAAVNAINNEASLAQYKAATEAARALSAAGNVDGIVGVSEANTKLAGYETEINNYEGNSKTLVDAVAKLNSAKNLTLAERRALIVTANAAKANAHDECTGVTAAKADIDRHTAAYLAEISAANDALNAALTSSVTVAPSVIGQTKYAEIVEIVKLLLNPVSSAS